MGMNAATANGNSVVLVGIDPGKSGGIAVNRDGVIVAVMKMPQTPHDLNEELSMVVHVYQNPVFFVEKVHSMPGQGVASSFSFGRQLGLIEGVIASTAAPMHFVTPQVWQKAMSCQTGGDKNITKAAAQRLWPGIQWTHAIADAALLSEYGRLKCAGLLSSPATRTPRSGTGKS